jgi:DNA-binding MarR family transcriptional regulator
MYEQTVKLRHNEVAAKINIETGEYTEVSKKQFNVPEGKELFNPGSFSKRYDAAWNYLLENLTDKELSIVVKMTLVARFNSNSLEPLSNVSSVEEIAEHFGIHRNSVTKMFNKLLKHGVYAEFKFGAFDGIRHYWVLNPYISFKGKTIDKALVDLFRTTNIAKLVAKNGHTFIVE